MNFWLVSPRKSGSGWVVQKVDNALHQLNHFPVDIVCFVDTYPLHEDSDLSGG